MESEYQTSVTHWFAELAAGNREAPQHLWATYFESIVRLARKRWGTLPKRVADEEDVAASVFRCLCNGAEQARFPANLDRTELWKLLVVITKQKIVDHIRRTSAAKRGGGAVQGESAFLNAQADFTRRGIEQVLSVEPTPDFILEMEEQHHRLLQLLQDETLQQVANFRLEGLVNQEIAEHMGISLRSVERKLQLIRERWADEVVD